MRSQFALIELITFIVILSILGVVLIPKHTGGAKTRASMKNYIMLTYPEYDLNSISVTCNTRDNDGDGYVMCTGTVRNDKNNLEHIEAECATTYSFISGCTAVNR